MNATANIAESTCHRSASKHGQIQPPEPPEAAGFTNDGARRRLRDAAAWLLVQFYEHP